MNKMDLNPENHAYAVHHFMDFFYLKPAAADADHLGKILQAFAEIPYENISKIIKLNEHFLSEQRLRLPEEVMEDFSRYHLGGTCFSLSFFLHCVLYHQGYHSYIVMADMRHRANVHCALNALLHDKVYLIDPGYLLTQPMPIHPDTPRLHRAPHSGVELRFDAETGRYQLFTFDRQVIKLRYSFAAEPTPLAEFLQHWLSSFYHATMHGICLTRVQDQHLIYLHNDYLQIAGLEGKISRHLGPHYEQLVTQMFGIDSEWVERAREALVDNLQLERAYGLFSPAKARHDEAP